MNTVPWRDRIAVLTAVLAPLAVAAVLVPLRTSIPNACAALVLLMVVVAIAANGHRLAGIVAAASAALWFDFFLTTPYEQFMITNRGDIETTVSLLLVGTAVTELAVRGRRQHRLVVTDAVYLAAIAATTELVAAQTDPRVVMDQVRIQLTSPLGLRGCRFERGRYGDLPRLGSEGRVQIDGGTWDLDQHGMPNTGVEILASNKGNTYGRFVLYPVPGTLPPPAARQVAVILVNQVGAALASQARTPR